MRQRESILGSAGCQPAAFGSLPNAPEFKSHVIVNACSRQAAANYRLAACAPQNEVVSDVRQMNGCNHAAGAATTKLDRRKFQRHQARVAS